MTASDRFQESGRLLRNRSVVSGIGTSNGRLDQTDIADTRTADEFGQYCIAGGQSLLQSYAVVTGDYLSARRQSALDRSIEVVAITRPDRSLIFLQRVEVARFSALGSGQTTPSRLASKLPIGARYGGPLFFYVASNLQPHGVEHREGAGEAKTEHPGKIPHRTLRLSNGRRATSSPAKPARASRDRPTRCRPGSWEGTRRRLRA